MFMLTVLTMAMSASTSFVQVRFEVASVVRPVIGFFLENYLHALLLLLNMQRCIQLACHKFTTVSGAILFDQSDVNKPFVIL